MCTRTIFLSMLACLTAVAGWSADGKAPDLEPVLAKRGKLIFEESFSGPAIDKAWRPYKGEYALEGEALKSREKAEDKHHPAINHKLAAKNIIIQASFKFDGAKWMGLSLDNKEHVARMMISPTGFRVIKVTGIGPTTKSEPIGEKKFKFEQGKWYTILYEILGNETIARIDDQTYAFGQSTGIDVDKTRFELINGGEWCAWDNVKVWEAEPNPAWAAYKSKLVVDKKAK